METIQNYMTTEHKSCDSTYAHFEESILDDDLNGTKEYGKKFSDEMGIHLKREEEVLFPAFEEVSGGQMGPTQVMRMEHTQIREMLKKIEELANSGITKESKKKLIGLLETLMILMQQHNMKEEQILYPMADRALQANCENIITSMKQIQHV
ncbi:MAG: hemerythrin domain-containing protein [Spirochaetia bacterium]|nr:hemerythrin domain-containing protein [Spirochaetia bacterium]